MQYDGVISYDLETTGFSFKNDSILEIGAVSYNPHNEQKETFQFLINQNKPIPKHITKLTGIHNNSKGFLGGLHKAVTEFHDFAYSLFNNPLFVGHNILLFDNKFINPQLDRFGYPLIKDFDSWDTYIEMKSKVLLEGSRIFRLRHKKVIHKKLKIKANLSAACGFYKIKSNDLGSHRALPDAERSLLLFLKQIKYSEKRALFVNNKQ